MAKSNEAQDKNTTTPAPKQTAPSCARNQLIFTGLASVIALLAIAISGYTLQCNKHLRHQLFVTNKALMNTVAQIEQNQANEQEKITEQANLLGQKQSEFQNKMDELNKELQTALSQTLYQSKDWLLLKTRYYLELAQINNHWSDNLATTIALLKEADSLLKGLSSPKIFSIRQAIAKEIAELKDIPAIDIAGILSQLDAAQLSVDQLSFETPAVDNNSAIENETAPSSVSSAWKNHLQSSIALLKNIVVIRRNDEEIKPLMSPLYESMLKESVRLNLEEAQWAVLNGNQEIFQRTLLQAITNLKRITNGTSQSATSLLNQLDELQKTTIVREKPAIGLALPLLNDIIDTNELLNNNPAGGKKS